MKQYIKLILVSISCLLGISTPVWGNDNETHEDKGDILYLHPKETIEPILSTFKWAVSDINYNKGEQVNFTLLWFSDLHSIWRRLLRISTFYKEYEEYIDDVICTGDAFHKYESFDAWGKNGGASFINVVGNHECFGPQRNDGTKIIPGWTSPAYSSKECYEMFYKPFLHETHLVITENKCYFYKDYSAFNIRIIGIDGYHWKEKPMYIDKTPIEVYPDGDVVDRGEQQKWFKKTLAEAKDKGMHVICLVHQPAKHIPEYRTGFQCLEPFTYNTTAKAFYEWHQDVQDFIDEGGHFITWFCGHHHDDRFGVIESYPDQLQICIDTAGSKRQQGTRWDRTGRFDRIENSVNDDLFNIVSVNIFSKRIMLYRIGCNFDKFGRRIESLCYDYGEKKLIYP